MASFALPTSSALLGTLALGFAGLALAGCPLWSDDNNQSTGCFGDCCYGECNVDTCNSQGDCGSNEVCGQDNQCHIGACDTWGCPSGSVCLTDIDGNAICVDNSNTGGGGVGGGGAGGSGAGGSGPTAIYCGNPDDCSLAEHCAPDGICTAGDCSVDGCIFGFSCDVTAPIPTCIPLNPAACAEDFDCISFGLGYACVSGVCTAPADQCFDQTQCPSGDVCANGKCTPSCANSAACDASYTCTAGVDLCTTPAQACNITNDCNGSPVLVCVDGACVPRSDQGVCPAGSVWVENGCIPNQTALFVCAVDGEQDVCAAGSICLHHSCYISCAAPNDTACVGLPDFDQCKTVTTSSGDHQVCGSDQNLGNECDPTAGLLCGPGLVCIDGFCT